MTIHEAGTLARAFVKMQWELMGSALEASDVHEFRRRAFRILDGVVGYDLATMQSIAHDGVLVATSDGWVSSADRVDLNIRYTREMGRMQRAAMQSVLLIPEDFPGWKESRFFHEQFVPYGAKSGWVRAWGTRFGFGAIIMARNGRSAVSPRKAAFLDRLIPVLAANDTLVGVEGAGRDSGDPGLNGYGLTAREKEIAVLVRRGLTNPEIATLLGSSPFTVRNQLASIFRKCDVSSRSELASQLSSLRAQTKARRSADVLEMLESTRVLEVEGPQRFVRG